MCFVTDAQNMILVTAACPDWTVHVPKAAPLLTHVLAYSYSSPLWLVRPLTHNTFTEKGWKLTKGQTANRWLSFDFWQFAFPSIPKENALLTEMSCLLFRYCEVSIDTAHCVDELLSVAYLFLNCKDPNWPFSLLVLSSTDEFLFL